MECERLQRLIKSWYAQVQDESMAPARMVSFMEKHITECAFCLADPLVRQDIEKITVIILPPVKIRKPANGENDLVNEPEEILPEDDNILEIENEDSDDDVAVLGGSELDDDDLADDE